jgi:ATP-dependent RNA helicase DeaD
VRYLLDQARVNAAWLPVPKPSQVRKAIIKKTRRQLHAGLKQVDQLTETELRYAQTLLESWPADQLIATLLRQAAPEMPRDPIEVASLSAREPVRERPSRRYSDRPGDRSGRGPRRGRFDEPRGRRRRDDSRDRDYRAGPQEGYVRFFINWGGRNGANPSRILSHVCRRGNVSSREVGAIRVGPFSSTFELTEQVAYDFEQQVRAPDERDPNVYIRRWRED